MLFLSRGPEESIFIEIDKILIEIKVIKIDKNNNLVSLGFEAPKNVGIYRNEIFKKRRKNGTPFKRV